MYAAEQWSQAAFLEPVLKLSDVRCVDVRFYTFELNSKTLSLAYSQTLQSLPYKLI